MKASPSTKFKTVDEYLSSLPVKTRALLKGVQKAIRKAAPHAEEVISYNIPTFKLNGYLIYYAAWKEHISLYPRTAAMERELKRELAEYEDGKGTLKFPIDKPLPLDLIRRIVRVRVQENIEREKAKVIKKAAKGKK